MRLGFSRPFRGHALRGAALRLGADAPSRGGGSGRAVAHGAAWPQTRQRGRGSAPQRRCGPYGVFCLSLLQHLHRIRDGCARPNAGAVTAAPAEAAEVQLCMCTSHTCIHTCVLCACMHAACAVTPPCSCVGRHAEWALVRPCVCVGMQPVRSCAHACSLCVRAPMCMCRHAACLADPSPSSGRSSWWDSGTTTSDGTLNPKPRWNPKPQTLNPHLAAGQEFGEPLKAELTVLLSDQLMLCEIQPDTKFVNMTSLRRRWGWITQAKRPSCTSCHWARSSSARRLLVPTWS
eukprot:363338-Chlamydomonas_euryale.AAC.1